MGKPADQSLDCQLTFWSEASRSHVKTSAQQERERDWEDPDQVCGLFSCGWCRKCDPNGYSLRTFLRLELEALMSCSMGWIRQATPAGRSWWVLSMSERRTDDTVFGSWGTPQAFDAEDCKRSEAKRSGGCRNLREEVHDWPTTHGMDNSNNPRANGPTGNELGRAVTLNWSTPKESDPDHSGPNMRNGTNVPLPAQVLQAWPTPAARDWKGDEMAPAAANRKSPCLPAAAYVAGQPDPANSSTNGKSQGSLNSEWVAQLQGYPSDWLDVEISLLSKPSETPSCHKSPKP